MDLDQVKMPVAQIVYGEFVYWVTVLSALVCMVGPVIALASPDGNLLNPHYLFARIFDGESPAGVWALSSTGEVGLDATVGGESRPGTTVHEALSILDGLEAPASLELEGLTVSALAGEEGERAFTLDPGGKVPHERAREAVLERYSREVFHDGHFWATHTGRGDGFTQLGLALGCSVALWALLATALAYVRERFYLYAFLALWVSALVFLSAAGIISGGH
jgi:hypothetical protein